MALTRRTKISAVVAALVAVGAGGGAALLWGGASNEPSRAATSSSNTTSAPSATSTTAPPADEVPPIGAAPLTGLPITEATAANMARPPLAIKVDNSVEAMPQVGLGQADLVFEIEVEGISRLMAVYHSADADEVGPTRSARLSDPPILALLGTPLFGWSGANDGVAANLADSFWIVNVNWDRAKSAYRRSSDRRAPHNLMTSTDALFRYARDDQPPPLQVFRYLVAGQTQRGEPAAGVTLSVGTTPSEWAWNGLVYERWQYGRRHTTTDTGPVTADNVVIVQTRYTGGRAAPTATTVGEGPLTVVSGGRIVEGRWVRPSQLEPMLLIDDSGVEIALAPGRTWVEFTDGATSSVLSAGRAERILGG